MLCDGQVGTVTLDATMNRGELIRRRFAPQPSVNALTPKYHKLPAAEQNRDELAVLTKPNKSDHLLFQFHSKVARLITKLHDTT